MCLGSPAWPSATIVAARGGPRVPRGEQVARSAGLGGEGSVSSCVLCVAEVLEDEGLLPSSCMGTRVSLTGLCSSAQPSGTL